MIHVPDIFYDIQDLDLKKVRSILKWAHKNALKTQVDELDCSVSFRRQASNKSFEEVMEHLDKRSVGYFRVVLRQPSGMFEFILEKYTKEEVLEIFIRSIEIENVEHFFFIYLDKDKMDYLRKKYVLKLL